MDAAYGQDRRWTSFHRSTASAHTQQHSTSQHRTLQVCPIWTIPPTTENPLAALCKCYDNSIEGASIPRQGQHWCNNKAIDFRVSAH